MEFALSRTVMAFCGLMLLCGMMGPFSSFLDANNDRMAVEAVDDLSALLDACVSKGEGYSRVIIGSEILPSPSWYIEIHDRHVILCNEEDRYVSLTTNALYGQETIVISYGDIMLLTVQADGGNCSYRLEKVDDIFDNVSMSTSISSSSL